MSPSLRAGKRCARIAWLRGIIVLVGVAVADPSALASERDPTPASPAPSREQALYEEAKAKHAQGDFEGARVLLEQCYELSRRPELLFNLGQLERQQGHCASALGYYRDYVARLPDGPGIEVARKAIGELDQECPSVGSTEPAPSVPADTATEQPPPLEGPVREATAPTPVAPPADVPSSAEARTRRVLGWCGIGAGVLAVGTAAYFALDAADARRDANELLVAAQHGTPDAPWDETGAPLERQEERSTRWAIGFAVLGGLLGAAGTTLLLWDTVHPNRGRPAVAVTLDPGAGSAELIASF
jgi:hypothetical protein